MKLWKKDGDSRKNLMMLCLAAAGVMEFLFITLENLFGGLGYYLTETYLIVPALLFLGCALGGQLTKFARQRLLLAGAAISWFVLVQIIHKLSGMDTHPIATVFFVYLMGFPFASVCNDRENAGIKWIGGMFLAASLVLVGYTVALMTDLVPERLQQFIFWDGARLHVFWHPNISACFFMIGMGFAAAFLAQSKKTAEKVLLAAVIILEFAAMALTNCRTTLLMTGALVGGIVFFLISKGGWQRFLLGLLAALALLVGTFKVSGGIYQWNHDRLVEQYIQSQEQAEMPEAEADAEADAEPVEEVLVGENGQGTLSNDMRTLNNRTEIWEAAFRAVRDSKSLALFGTEYSGTVISAYNRFEVFHGHNSWIEAMMRMGIPGLLMSLVFTVMAVFCAAKLLFSPVELWKKIISMLTMCVLFTGFLEPYLFITNVYYHVTDFAFFFLLGYLDYWANAEPKENA